MAVRTVKFDKQFKKLVKALSNDNVTKALMSGGFIVEREAKLNIRKQKLIDTGNLRGSIKAEPDVGERRVTVGTSVIYGAIHEFGGVITPKNAKALRFQIDGRWVTTQKVTIPARPYLRPAFDDNKERIIQTVAETASQIILGAI